MSGIFLDDRNMRTYAFTLHVKIGDKVVQDGFEAQIEAVSEVEAILIALVMLDSRKKFIGSAPLFDAYQGRAPYYFVHSFAHSFSRSLAAVGHSDTAGRTTIGLSSGFHAE